MPNENFDRLFQSLPKEEQDLVNDATRKINDMDRTCVVETGREILRVKSRTPHGFFESWMRFKLPFTLRTARNRMSIARVCDAIRDLKPNGGKELEEEILTAVPHIVLYKLGSTYISEIRRRNLIQKIINKRITTEDQIIKEVDALSPKKISKSGFTVWYTTGPLAMSQSPDVSIIGNGSTALVQIRNQTDRKVMFQMDQKAALALGKELIKAGKLLEKGGVVIRARA